MRPTARVFTAEVAAAKRGRSAKPAGQASPAQAAERMAAATGRVLAERMVRDNASRPDEPGE